MLKHILPFLMFSFFLATAHAQKTINDPNVEARDAKAYHAIEVSGGIDLYLSYGEEAIAVSAKDLSTRERIKTEVKDGVLKIYYDRKDGVKFAINKNMRAYVSYKTLSRLSASGGSDIHVDGTIQQPALHVSVSGGSDFNGRVEVDKLKVVLSGGSDMNVSGFAKDLVVEASGGCDVDGYGLVTETCNASASGGSDISITVNKELSAEASGGSDVNWKGAATVKKVRASGAGSVSHRS